MSFKYQFILIWILNNNRFWIYFFIITKFNTWLLVCPRIININKFNRISQNRFLIRKLNFEGCIFISCGNFKNAMKAHNKTEILKNGRIQLRMEMISIRNNTLKLLLHKLYLFIFYFVIVFWQMVWQIVLDWNF